ncbi:MULTISPECIES: HAD-IA family hydrolase [Kitasatospora]|nr:MULTISPECIES: HAD-IA family hydrolase [Kitasatospora]
MSDRPFDALLCDLDNVLRFYAYDEVARQERAAGLAPGSTAAIAFAPERDLPLLLGRIGREEWTAAIAAELAVRVPAGRAAGLARAFAYAPSRVDREVEGLLRRVRGRGVPLVLVTNATPWLDEDLDRLGLADLADHVVNSSRIGLAKPDPAVYALAVGLAGVPAGRCAFVDDSGANVEAARAAGLTAVHYRGAAGLRRLVAPVLGPTSAPAAGPVPGSTPSPVPGPVPAPGGVSGQAGGSIARRPGAAEDCMVIPPSTTRSWPVR